MLNTSLKQSINSTFAEYNDGTVELEARFGRSTQYEFKSGVTRSVFNRIKQYFDSRSGSEYIKTTDYIGKNNVRKTITLDNEEVWIKKVRLWNQTISEYGLRISMSREIPIDSVPDFKPTVIREKTRYSYLVFNSTVRIDLTIVNMLENLSKKGKDGGTTYEVEIELVKTNGLRNFEVATTVTLQQVLDTNKIYTQSEATTVKNYINSLLNSQKRGYIDHYPLVQARNLKLKDMTYGGLIGNQETGYSVTHKADGQRKMLVFHETGIWLAMAPHSLNKVSDIKIPELIGTILDGELIPLNNRLDGSPKTKYWYLSFDCLTWSGRSVRDKMHGVRMNHSQAVADKVKTELLWVNTKIFKNFGTPQEFFAVMREMFRNQEVIQYKQDGFMFTPVNTIYNPHSEQYPLFKRNLNDYPDVCKWKPQEELTIDFQIRWKLTNTGKQIVLYANVKGQPKEFTGTKVFPYQGQVDINNTLTKDLPNGTVVEYGWNYTLNRFEPKRVRHDKTKPNKMDIAEDVWMDIQRPLDKETMSGVGFTLLRRYHNKIKKELFGSSEGTLLDIGSGRGGDVSKWKKYSKIVAVEPNPSHINELERRIKLHGMEHKVRVVQAGGEDIEKITRNVKEFIGDRVDTVSMMLSMSFFWRSESMVNRLINTITTNVKSDGKFVFLTIDGDLVEQTFEPAMNTGPVLTGMDLGPAKLRYFGDKSPKELHIHIEGTIVEDQTEWLVRLGDLVGPMKQFGFQLERERADKEKFLTEEEITMTQMYSYGTFVGNGTGNLPSIEHSLPGKEIEPALKTDPASIPDIITGDISIGPDPITPYNPPISSDISIELPLYKPLFPVETENTVFPDVLEMPVGSIPMDSHQTIQVAWYPHEKVVRIGAIGDGSCFYHSVLGAYYVPYQNNNNTKYRKNFVRLLRRDLAYYLQTERPDGKTVWEVTVGGQFKELYEQQELGLILEDQFGIPIDFSSEGLQKLLNSTRYLGDEVYGYSAEALGIDIYVTRLTTAGLNVHLDTSKPGVVRKVVVISGNGAHYEIIGVERNGLFQTVFDSNDPFIQALRTNIED